MKKSYEAPEILFEDFSLSTNIATNCEVTANHTDNVCGLNWGRFVLFTVGVINSCNRSVEDTGGLYDGLCYHNPSDDNNLFIS